MHSRTTAFSTWLVTDARPASVNQHTCVCANTEEKHAFTAPQRRHACTNLSTNILHTVYISRILFFHMLRKRIYRQVDELEVSMLGNHMDKCSMRKIAINTFMIKMHALLKVTRVHGFLYACISITFY